VTFELLNLEIIRLIAVFFFVSALKEHKFVVVLLVNFFLAWIFINNVVFEVKFNFDFACLLSSENVPSGQFVFHVESKEFVFNNFCGQDLSAIFEAKETNGVPVKNRNDVNVLERVHVNKSFIFRAVIKARINTNLSS